MFCTDVYIYIYIYKSVRLISVKQCSIHVSRAEYKVEKKIQTDYMFISTSLFRGSPDEWATTKQACRDKRVVRLNLFLYLIYIYILNLQTVLFQPLRSHQCSSEWFENWDMSTAQQAINTSHTDKQWHILFLNTRVLKLKRVSNA